MGEMSKVASGKPATLQMSPMTPTMGVEVSGVDISKPLDADTVAALDRALADHKVLVFRDQFGLTPETNVAFGRYFGELEVEPFRNTIDGLPIFVVEGYGAERWRDSWHVDMPFQPRPPRACILRGVKIPPVGRDTMWADMEAVYEDLSDTFKLRLEGLRAVHSTKSIYGKEAGRSKQHPDEKEKDVAFEADHPIVCTHPASGRKFIYVNRTLTRSIIGMTDRESTAILNFLFEQVRDPEYQLRVRWAPGTVVLWNNHTSQHRLIIDRPPSPDRILHRVTICGDVLV